MRTLILAGYCCTLLAGGNHPDLNVVPTQQLRNSALRLKLKLIHDPRYYLDEPVSAGMRVLAQDCEQLLDILDQNPVSNYKVMEQVALIKMAAKQLKQIRYDHTLPVRKRSIVTVNYFSAVD
ncbi:MAG: hypothetical protein ACE5D2_06315 [Fidelibacterota bacterium]